MRFSDPLDDLFRSKSFMKVLRVLSELPEDLPATGREIARRGSLSHPQASGVLSALASTGVVDVKRAPRRAEYVLNREHVLVQRLLPLLDWERRAREELVTFLRDALQARRTEVNAAVLFGSFVRGEMEPDSDIDLVVVVRKGRIEQAIPLIEALSDQVRRRFGNRLAPMLTESPPPKRATGVWSRIGTEGLVVVGSLDELSRRG